VLGRFIKIDVLRLLFGLSVSLLSSSSSLGPTNLPFDSVSFCKHFYLALHYNQPQRKHTFGNGCIKKVLSPFTIFFEGTILYSFLKRSLVSLVMCTILEKNCYCLFFLTFVIYIPRRPFSFHFICSINVCGPNVVLPFDRSYYPRTYLTSVYTNSHIYVQSLSLTVEAKKMNLLKSYGLLWSYRMSAMMEIIFNPRSTHASACWATGSGGRPATQ
jgi:hypothetical protein